MPKRRYSDEDRALALAANAGNAKLTARQLGIPETSLRHWRKGDRHPGAANMGAQKGRPWPTRSSASPDSCSPG
jgi:transposase-like protein